MAETIESFVARKLKDVSEEGKTTVQFLLQAGDSLKVIDRWDRPLRTEEGGPGPAALAQMISDVIDSAAQEWPAKRMHQVTITAFDQNGAESGMLTRSIKGGSQTATGSALASESVQHAAAMQMHTATMGTLLGAANAQIVLQQKSIEMLMNHNEQAMALLMSQKAERAIAPSGEPSPIQIEMWETLKTATPELLQLIGHFVQSRKG